MIHMNGSRTVKVRIKDFSISVILPVSAQLAIPRTWEDVEDFRVFQTDQGIKVLIAKVPLKRVPVGKFFHYTAI